MMIDLVIRQLVHEPVLMLDLCAAPGGKTTAARAVLPAGSLLVSNEPNRTRAQILVENTQKFGHPDIIVTNNYPRDFQKTKLQFDIILADVPCSGEGMFRKDEGAIGEWSLKNVDNCWRLQRDIIADIWPLLKPGGYLVYSTCTYNAHEDEENVEWIADNLGAKYIALDTDPAWNITGSLTDSIPVCRFIPGKTKGEGLFMAALQKLGEDEHIHREGYNSLQHEGNTNLQYEGCTNLQHEGYTNLQHKGKPKKIKGNNVRGGKAPQLVYPSTWLTETNDYECVCKDTDLYAIPKKWRCVYDEVADKLRVLHAGIKMGSIKGKDIIPDQSLALSTALNLSAFPQAELTYAEAIQYLRKEALSLPSETPRGFVLVCYKHVPLGWVKNLGNRANNLYPQEWKIKSSHVPEDCDILKEIIQLL